jgi:hypothetical protein
MHLYCVIVASPKGLKDGGCVKAEKVYEWLCLGIQLVCGYVSPTNLFSVRIEPLRISFRSVIFHFCYKPEGLEQA